MPSDYPTAKDVIGTMASHNDLGDAIEAIEATLGVDLAGGFADLAERLATPRWNDLRVALSSGRPNTSPPTFSTFLNGTQTWAFGAAATEQLYFEVQIPHGWVIGSEIRPHIHWSPGNSTNTGSVVWNLEYTWQNAADEVFPATTTVTATQAAAGVAYAHQIAQFPAIDGTGKRESSVLVCRLARVGGDAADTFTGSAFGISVDFHYQAEALGSVTEYPSAP